MPRTKRASGGGAGAEAATDPAQSPVVDNKADAIGEALRELGKRASRDDLIGYVRQKFGYEVSPNYVSVVKSKLKYRRGKKGKGQREEQDGRTYNGRGNTAAVFNLIRDVKDLAARAGGLGQLRKLIDLLAQ